MRLDEINLIESYFDEVFYEDSCIVLEKPVIYFLVDIWLLEYCW